MKVKDSQVRLCQDCGEISEYSNLEYSEIRKYVWEEMCDTCMKAYLNEIEKELR